MLYYLFELLEKLYQFPGASVFQYISFRAAAAVIISMGLFHGVRCENNSLSKTSANW
jgi:cytidine deaminase